MWLTLALGMQSEGLREETFTTIERQYMVGLRASDPVVRAKFFSLYNAAVPHSLYDRLKFILEEQDWTRVSHTFWIKHGLVWPSRLWPFRNPKLHAPAAEVLPGRAAMDPVRKKKRSSFKARRGFESFMLRIKHNFQLLMYIF